MCVLVAALIALRVKLYLLYALVEKVIRVLLLAHPLEYLEFALHLP